MRRASATASYGLYSTGVPIIAWPLLTEFYPDGYENFAFPVSKNMDFFKQLPSPVSLESLDDEWWTPV